MSKRRTVLGSGGGLVKCYFIKIWLFSRFILKRGLFKRFSLNAVLINTVMLGWLSFGPLAHAAEFHLVDASGNAMTGMVVYLQQKSVTEIHSDIAGKSAVGIVTPLEIHQKNKQFTPYITVIQKGYELQFINDDDITHHIYSAAGPKRFSFKLRKDNMTRTMVFDQVGHISMGCNVHDWMSGHVLVVDTPYFGMTDQSGKIRFDTAPDDEYALVIWHPQLSAENHRLSRDVSLPMREPLVITVSASMADIPAQQSLDDFEFLDGY